MPDNGIKLDRKGIAELLKSDAFAALTNETARKIASDIGPDAEVEAYTTDRKAASVKVPAERQARDGALTRAASANGLTVTAKRK
jgi:hypothetical protein